MIKICIDSLVKERCPNLVLGCLAAHVKVRHFDEKLWKEVEVACNEVKEKVTINDVLTQPNIKISRDGYKALGKDPSRYKLSSESLLRRIVKGNGLYKVNTVVDINNLVSIVSNFSVGSYDLDCVGTSICLERAGEGQFYEGIGRGEINLYNLPVFVDMQGAFGSPTSDSYRAMIKESTERMLMVIISFSGEEQLEHYLQYGKDLLIRYAEGEEISSWIVK